jgi:hypothetical protein
MKLITEMTESVQFITEDKEGKKNYHIEGVFMQSGVKNRNGRIYPSQTLANEVNRYSDVYVKNQRAMGELGHPDGPTVNLERVSHIITGLDKDGDNINGKAKILDTPYGKIVKNLMDEGAKLGVSSRGMGSIKQLDNGINEVQEDFMLAAVDIVADPSAPNAFVNGIMEGKEWIWDNGIVKEVHIHEYQREIERTSRRNLEKKTINLFSDFISKL